MNNLQYGTVHTRTVSTLAITFSLIEILQEQRVCQNFWGNHYYKMTFKSFTGRHVKR